MTADASLGRLFIDDARGQLALCQRRIDHCLGQLSEEQLWHRQGPELNSIGNLVLHVSGNLRQRILSVVGGQPDTRDRDAEFAQRGPLPKAEVATRFAEAVRQADVLLAALEPATLGQSRRYQRLRGEVEGSVLGVILQTLVHVGGHTQEIVSLSRQLLGSSYRFLLVPESR